MRLSTQLAVLGLAALVAAACGPSADQPTGFRQRSESYTFRVSADVSPPAAREPIEYTIVILDRATGRPVENGEGQLFAQNIQGKQTYDALAPSPEAGTYKATVSFLLADQWAVGIRFRRDSTAPLERIDWMQEVVGERNPIQ
ncbi:MAG TPA: hypothetical protein VMM77_12615, partial [Gemmatimonadaceae bacterium]|nr:hypothetical protein [Gemmatimonadaceae bacterium]